MKELAFDTETSGIDPKKYCLLTAYFAVLDENSNIIDDLELKVKPDDGEIPFEQSALDVNGIDLELHKQEAITYSEAKPILLDFLKKNNQGKKRNLQPSGHNISFDIGFLTSGLLTLEEWERYCHYRVYDTTPITTILKKCDILPEKVGSLSSLVDHFGIEKRNAHNAKEDVLMWIEVSKELKKMLRDMKKGALSSSSGLDILITE